MKGRGRMKRDEEEMNVEEECRRKMRGRRKPLLPMDCNRVAVVAAVVAVVMVVVLVLVVVCRRKRMNIG